ncbi:hypothetical protein C7212DRAFT_180884, partial [Tuber magnatum]
FNMSDYNGVWIPLETRPFLVFEPLLPNNQHQYQSLVQSILHLMLGTWLDLTFMISVLLQFSPSASLHYLVQAKCVLRYLW